jgi:hypothetical protein
MAAPSFEDCFAALAMTPWLHSYSCCFVEQFPPDQHTADFGSARAYFIELGIA